MGDRHLNFHETRDNLAPAATDAVPASTVLASPAKHLVL